VRARPVHQSLAPPACNSAQPENPSSPVHKADAAHVAGSALHLVQAVVGEAAHKCRVSAIARHQRLHRGAHSVGHLLLGKDAPQRIQAQVLGRVLRACKQLLISISGKQGLAAVHTGRMKAYLVRDDSLELALGVLGAAEEQQRLERLVGHRVLLRQPRRQRALCLHALQRQHAVLQLQVRQRHEPQHLSRTGKVSPLLACTCHGCGHLQASARPHGRR